MEGHMKHTLENNTLTLYLEGELNSYTSKDVEKEIESIMSGQTFDKVILDLEKLTYISSAGLRIVVRIKKQCDNLTLVKVPNGVYDIFKMVGFDNVVKIER